MKAGLWPAFLSNGQRESWFAVKSDFFVALTQLASERHLPKEEVLKAIEAALASAFRKDNWGDGLNVAVKLNPNTGEIKAYALKTVVDEEIEDPRKEISLKEAQGFKADAVTGDVIELEAINHQASRIAAQTAKQVVLQRLREAERELVFEEFAKRTGDIISGVVGQLEPGRGIIIELDRAEALLGIDEQVPTERYRRGQRLKVYVLEVQRSAKGPEILVSRTHKNLLKRLFEVEVPEVYNGIVEIRSIAREAGSRSKVAVVALQDGVDPVGSCIGMRGNRIQNIVNELQGEKIDVVRWDRELKRLISNALSPAEVVHVEADDSDKTASVVVPERQLSLAIGKEGQNARLAAKLTGWHLDIKGMAEWETLRAQIKLDAEDESEVLLEVEDSLAEELIESEAIAEPTSEDVVEEAVVEEGEEEGEKEEKVAVPVLEEALAEILAQEAVQGDETESETEEEAQPILSIEEELVALTLEAEAPSVEELGDEIWQTAPQLTPDAGKIRFAEDILEDFRGSRRERRTGGGRDRKKSGRARNRAGGTSVK